MSKITQADIKKISHLARIKIAGENQEDMAKQLGSIIGWIEKLNEVNTDNVEPLTNPYDMLLRLNEDKIDPAQDNIAENILKNSKNVKYNYFTVPKVIE
jgi:aspartyl-tRNA(Asn)/glutamyl-tRNA(Gln) amidotransferase subunit C